jgi:hypothetical protein
LIVMSLWICTPAWYVLGKAIAITMHGDCYNNAV